MQPCRRQETNPRSNTHAPATELYSVHSAVFIPTVLTLVLRLDCVTSGHRTCYMIEILQAAVLDILKCVSTHRGTRRLAILVLSIQA